MTTSARKWWFSPSSRYERNVLINWSLQAWEKKFEIWMNGMSDFTYQFQVPQNHFRVQKGQEVSFETPNTLHLPSVLVDPSWRPLNLDSGCEQKVPHGVKVASRVTEDWLSQSGQGQVRYGYLLNVQHRNQVSNWSLFLTWPKLASEACSPGQWKN